MKINVPHIAKLANLTVTEEEIPKFEKQLSAVLEHVAKLDSVDVKNVEPTSQVTGLENVLGTDEAKPSLPQKKALSDAKTTHNGQFMVKGILDQT